MGAKLRAGDIAARRFVSTSHCSGRGRRATATSRPRRRDLCQVVGASADEPEQETRMASSRQIKLGAFMRPTTIHTGGLALSRRLQRRQFQSRPHHALRPAARRGKVRRLLHGRSPRRAQHACRGAEAQPHRHFVRSADAACRRWRCDQASGPDRDRLDDLRAALHGREPFRLARSYQRRPGRMEHRDDLQSRRRAQFRP